MKKSDHPSKPGLKKIIPPLNKVEELAARGLTNEEIALSLGISEDTLSRRKKEIAEVAEAIKRGRAKGHAAIANKCFEMAQTDKGVADRLFYLERRAGWKRPEIYLPSPTEERRLVIEVVEKIIAPTGRVIEAKP